MVILQVGLSAVTDAAMNRGSLYEAKQYDKKIPLQYLWQEAKREDRLQHDPVEARLYRRHGDPLRFLPCRQEERQRPGE